MEVKALIEDRAKVEIEAKIAAGEIKADPAQAAALEPLIRLAVQQSNCFVITAVGNARTDSRLTAITDRQRNSGEFRAGSNQQKGQRVAADYLRGVEA